MSRKKQEIALQEDIETDEKWDEFTSKAGVCVIDVYQGWCGPCKTMIPYLKKVKNDVNNDKNLHFATANANKVTALKGFTGCKPCFLMIAGKELVGMIRETNVPLIVRTIPQVVEHEVKVQAGEATREVVDSFEYGNIDAPPPSSSKCLDDEPDVLPPDRSFTIAIIKPDVVREGRVDDVITKIKEAGIDILEYMERQLSEDEAASFYAHKKEEPYFDELVKFMSSGPSHVLVLAKDKEINLIEEWRELLGPATVEDAKASAPDSLRAAFGTEGMINALHGSDSTEAAMRELAFFFPDFHMNEKFTEITGSSKKKPERTLALIRPDALKESKEAVLEKIKEAGFAIALHREVHLTTEQAEEFYSDHRGEPYFDELIGNMTSGPLLALALVKNKAVTSWRSVLGPKEVDKAKAEAPDSLRAQFAVANSNINPLHGADSPASAARELDFFFPKQKTVAVIKPDAYEKKEEIIKKIEEAGFKIAASKDTDLTTDLVSKFYMDAQGKPFFNDLSGHMTSGKTTVLVLCKENAVHDWRDFLGPTDPAEAQVSKPDSIRAQFGKDTLANAVHGTSTEEKAKEAMQLVFDEKDIEKVDAVMNMK